MKTETVMDPARIVILDLGPKVCREDHSAQLSILLRGFMSPSVIALQTVHCFPAEIPAPELILLRPACAQRLSEIASCLRSRWHRAFIIGVFCTGEDRSVPRYHALGNDLDDFLTCP